MAETQDPRAELARVKRFDQLVAYLREKLDWPVDPDHDFGEELTFDYTPEDLGIDAKNAAKIQGIKSLRPLEPGDQPWGIFFLDFGRKRLPITLLRTILRALVKKKRQAPAAASRKAWDMEDLLFVCSHLHEEGQDAITFVHFDQPPVKGRAARIASFGWTQDTRNRTVLEFNLPPLKWPEDPADAEAWRRQWAAAFDKQRLTDAFFKEYRVLFNNLQDDLHGQTGDLHWAHDYALRLLNRCMFLCFIQRKRWLGGDPDFLQTFWNAYRQSSQPTDTFFEDWLQVLFFEAFNNSFRGGRSYFPPEIAEALALAPFLNGGLFGRDELDRKHAFALADARFEQIMAFLGRYNFTVTEDTPLDQEVAVDAEMLGRVYESLVNLGETGDERGDAGIFYTPRTEIDLMCRLALVDCLSNRLGEGRKPLLYEAVFAFAPDEKRDADEHLEREDLWPALAGHLENLSAVDPACGSGSFLVGMLQVLDDLAERANRALGRQETPYERRKRIIGRSLYGVDVMPWAVEVAELRLWLQLVIETDLQRAELQFRPLLPNLSFKVRCGDSLVQELGGVPLGHVRAQTPLPPHLKGRLTRLKGEKLHYYNNEKGGKFATRESLEKEERGIFRDVLLHREHELANRLKALRRELDAKGRDLHGEERHALEGGKRKEAEAEAQRAEAALQKVRAALQVFQKAKAAPFVWDVAFVEIFTGDRSGFDIVVGNPPYVRQEKIADPASPKGGASQEDRKAYKAKLARSVYDAYPSYFGHNEPRWRTLDSKCDLYVYFYFHGLSLLNPQGAFSFITSNSWLDVGYGKCLQEFLLDRCHVKMVLDNQARRSFASADVNTVIVLFSAPSDRAGWGQDKTARFAMFRVPFDQALSPVVFQEIEEAKTRRATPEYRVFPIRQKRLLAEGREPAEKAPPPAAKGKKGKAPAKASGPGIKVARYVGDKWGGKYLRAPDIYWTIMEKGRAHLRTLGDFFTGERYLNTGGADGFFVLSNVQRSSQGRFHVYNPNVTNSENEPFSGEVEEEFLKPLIKQLTRNDKRIEIHKHDAFCLVVNKPPTKSLQAYIKWAERQGYHLRSVTKNQKPWYKPTNQMLRSAKVLVPRSFNDRFIIHYNPRQYLSLRFYRLHPRGGNEQALLGYLNSTLLALIMEVLGNKALGQGVLDFFMADFLGLSIPVIENPDLAQAFVNIKKRPILPIWQEFGHSGHQAFMPLSDRRNLDDIVFDALRLTCGEREAVYEAAINLVEARLSKAGSLSKKKGQ